LYDDVDLDIGIDFDLGGIDEISSASEVTGGAISESSRVCRCVVGEPEDAFGGVHGRIDGNWKCLEKSSVIQQVGVR